MTTYERGKLYEISIIDFKLDPDQPRKVIDPDALAELTASIKTHGILQPLLFRQGDQGWLYIVSGERRYRAAKELGLLTLPAMLVEGNHAEIALVENLLRQDLTAVEEAEALQRLKDDQQYTDEQLSGVIGRARTTLSDILLINRLPAEIRDECRGDRKVSKSALIEIARKKQARAMLTAWTKYKEKQAKAAAGATRKEKAPPTPEELIDWVTKANTKLNAIDPAAWTEEEKTALAEALEDLQETVGGLLL
ncbi:MAG TPA: ParB/RepB/Spo0J family partition protein, partial [Syntrophales bacterium]|nr:ParB/RepB/Spo0J family partition protein [Syntrophales bacterium]